MNKKKKEQRPLKPEQPSREELDQALNEYLAKGGKIKVIEPLWIEEGNLFSR